jgi:glycosyltransferase involved in cell wall biosynthesis
MKVIEVITDTNIGGAGVLLVNRLRHTDHIKNKTWVLIPRGSALISRLKGISVEVIEMDCSYDCSFEVSAILNYVRVVRKIRPDVINCHGALSARIAAWLCRVPIKICTRHCVFPVEKEGSIGVRIKGYINSRLSDAFIAVAFAARQNLLELGVDKDKIAVIINGAEPLRLLSSRDKAALRKELGILDEETVLVLNARLEPYKGHLWFFEAVRQLVDDNFQIKVLLLGDGSERTRLESLCVGYGIDKHVIFMGFVDDVAPFMNIADININCSTGTETSSLALSEGMSIGLPAVASDFGGNPYMVRHCENGFVCKCYAHSELAKYIKLLINDKELYSEMSLAARQRFEIELNAVNMAEKTTALYDSLYKSYQKYGRSPNQIFNQV